MFKGKNILLGVTGSIAAYKAATLVRLFVKEGANVQVVMTPAATDFITPLTLSTLTKRPVLIEPFHESTGEWFSHVDWANWADFYLIAPATANTLSKMVTGQPDNLLIAIYLAARCQVYFAPAMDVDMYLHPSTQKNIETLQSYGNILIPPAEGELASGLFGKGRMDEPENIVDFLQKALKKKSPLNGRTALVTAGPTYENIDTVRYIGNHSSGKMGFAIATELGRAGCKVTLITGPVNLQCDHPLVNTIRINTAAEMAIACKENFQSAEIAVMTAAVADYRPATVINQKLKKKENEIEIKLEPTEDILAWMGKNRKKHQLLIGFALEDHDEKSNAHSKLRKKNLDFIVLNSLQDQGAGFGFDTNKITIIEKSGKEAASDLLPKAKIAEIIVQKIIELSKNKSD